MNSQNDLPKLTGDSALLLQRWRDGDQLAADELHSRYTARLISLLRQRISPKLRRRSDPDDVLQSAYRSFFVRAGRGEFEIVQPGDLWRLLATIALRKLARHAERHGAAKRSFRREAVPRHGSEVLLSREPSPAEAIAASEELNWLLGKLEPERRDAIELLLAGKTILEVAQHLGRTSRTIQRWLKSAKGLFEQRLACPDGGRHAPRNRPALKYSTSGESIEQCQILRLIGAGGICKVYAAREKSSGRSMCLKVLRKRHQDNRYLTDRFLREALLVSNLNHRGIVKVHGSGELPAGGYFMVMDLVDGRNLFELALERPFNATEVASIVRDVAIAIDYAHERGIVHCDLKPQNVLQSLDGRILVTDFGFAELEQESRARGDRPEHIAGTIGYLSPEQLRRDSPIGPRTDVYGLGALLFFLLNGEPPTAGGGSSSILWRAEGPAIEATAWRLDPPAALREICIHCLATDPAARYATASTVAHELAGFLDSHYRVHR